MKRYLLLVLAAGALVAQENPVLRGLIEGSRMAKERREQQLIEQQTRVLVEQERQMREDREARAQERQTQTQPVASTPQIDAAIVSVKGRYADFDVFRDEMARLLDLEDKLSLEERIERLYLIAKHSSFSRAALATKLNLRKLRFRLHM